MFAILMKLLCPSCNNKILYATKSYSKLADTDCKQCGHTFNVSENEIKDNPVLKEILKDEERLNND